MAEKGIKPFEPRLFGPRLRSGLNAPQITSSLSSRSYPKPLFYLRASDFARPRRKTVEGASTPNPNAPYYLRASDSVRRWRPESQDAVHTQSEHPHALKGIGLDWISSAQIQAEYLNSPDSGDHTMGQTTVRRSHFYERQGYI